MSFITRPEAALYVPSGVCTDSAHVPTWEDLNQMKFSPESLHFVRRRFQEGLEGSEHANPGRFTAAYLAWIAHGITDTGNHLLDKDFFYPESISLYSLPTDAEEQRTDTQIYREEYLRTIEFAIQDLVTLWERASNGMAFVCKVRGDRAFWSDGDGSAPLHTATSLTSRFVEEASHDEHLAVRASVDMVSQIFGPMVAKSLLEGRKNMVNRPGWSVVQARKAPCNYLPLSRQRSNLYLIPITSAGAWRWTYRPSMRTYPAPLRGEPPQELDLTYIDTLSSQLDRVRRENQELKDAIAFRDSLVVEHNADLSTIFDPHEFESKEKLVDHVNGLIGEFITASDGSKAEQAERIEDMMRAWVARTPDFVSREQYNTVIKEGIKLHRTYENVKATLESERETSERFRVRADRWATKFRSYLDLARSYYPCRDGQIPMAVADLPYIHRSDLSKAMGFRTHDFLYEFGLERYSAQILSIIASTQLVHWNSLVQQLLKDEPRHHTTNLLLCMGADLVNDKIGWFEKFVNNAVIVISSDEENSLFNAETKADASRQHAQAPEVMR
ncbi:hypothetical protein FISHEDRAFT_56896, partial [Fistulina hepatica ATCC 64428]